MSQQGHRQRMQRLRRGTNATDSSVSSPPPSSSPSPANPSTTRPTSTPPRTTSSPTTSAKETTTKSPPTSTATTASSGTSTPSSFTSRDSQSQSSSPSGSSATPTSSSTNSDSSANTSSSTSLATSNSRPTTMTNYVGSLTTFSLGPSSFSVSEISTITYEGGATPTKASGLSSKKQSLSAGAIFGIIMAVLIGIAAAFFLNACIRRRIRRAHRRQMRHRDRLARQSVHIPDEPALVMGTRNALALARANMGHNGISTPPPAIQVTEQNENRPYTDNPQTTEQDQYGSTHGEAYPDYYNTAVQPEVAHVQFQHPYAYDANGPPIVSRELTTNPPQMQHQYADLSHALSSPPPVHAANTGSPFSDPVESTYAPKRSNSGGQNGNTQDRFFMAQYAQPTRTGTPVDPNPQQYFTPGQGHNGGNMHAA